jgi:hypothetical protein
VKGDRITIVGGRGVGQYRRILSFDRMTGTIIVDKPWNVTPDNRSLISIGYLSDRVVVYNNRIDGKAAQVTAEAHTASVGVNLFGAAADFVVDGNVMTDLRHGIYNWMPDSGLEHQPMFSNMFVNNAIYNTREAIAVHAAGVGGGAIAYLGNVYRDNLVSGAIERGIIMRSIGLGTDANMNVVEDNTFFNMPVGMRIQKDTGAIKNTVFQRNRFVLGYAPFQYSIGCILFAVRDSLIRENVFEGFAEAEVLWGTLAP